MSNGQRLLPRAPRDALAGLQAGCEEWLAAMGEPELQRLYLVEGPAGLALRRWREIDAEHGGGSLREGIEAVLAERGEPKPRSTGASLIFRPVVSEE